MGLPTASQAVAIAARLVVGVAGAPEFRGRLARVCLEAASRRSHVTMFAANSQFGGDFDVPRAHVVLWDDEEPQKLRDRLLAVGYVDAASIFNSLPRPVKRTR